MAEVRCLGLFFRVVCLTVEERVKCVFVGVHPLLFFTVSQPANILLNSSGEVKLSDFGVIGKVDSTLGNATTFTGSSA